MEPLATASFHWSASGEVESMAGVVTSLVRSILRGIGSRNEDEDKEEDADDNIESNLAVLFLLEEALGRPLAATVRLWMIGLAFLPDILV